LAKTPFNIDFDTRRPPVRPTKKTLAAVVLIWAVLAAGCASDSGVREAAQRSNSVEPQQDYSDQISSFSKRVKSSRELYSNNEITGFLSSRDELVTDERRAAQRYTLSHLAHAVKDQTGISEPTRDWFPISLIGPFASFADLVHGPGADWGQMSCGCHPNCGVGTAVMVNKETREFRAVPEFLSVQSLVRDVTAITDAGRGPKLSNLMMGLALL